MLGAQLGVGDRGRPVARAQRHHAPALVLTGNASDLFIALAIGAVLMIIGGIVEIVIGVKAERMRLEGIAQPRTAVGGAVRGGAAQSAGAAGRRAGQAIRTPRHGST